MSQTVALYFVASPLQYLAARRIAERHEAGTRQVLIWYKRGVTPIVRESEWSAAAYMPWPRWEPMPGRFGRLKRLRANIHDVAQLVGPCDEIHIHSAVFDTEAINYFLRGLPRLCGAREIRARILPDGIISVRRYPLSLGKRVIQYFRKLRRLVAPELDYWCFSGDRIGSDAPFCDRVYVLPGLPHEYPPEKVVVLPPLIDSVPPGANSTNGEKRALVIGQPLVGAGLMKTGDRNAVDAEIRSWLASEGITQIFYKPHPKDPGQEMRQSGYFPLNLNEPLEIWMAHTPLDAVVGVRSSALLFARQIYGPQTRVRAFGWDRIIFKSEAEKQNMKTAFEACGVELG
jgi:hypothetical protein